MQGTGGAAWRGLAPTGCLSGPFLLLLLVLTVPASTNSDAPNWRWRCDDGRCLRETSPSASPESSASLPLCRLTCGNAGALWPKPRGALLLGDTLAPLHPHRVVADLSGVAGDFGARMLQVAVDRMLRSMARECGVDPPPPHSATSTRRQADPDLVVVIATTSPSPQLNAATNESYELRLGSKGSAVTVTVTVRAETAFGARHALETLSQLAACAEGDSGDAPLRLVTRAHITDSPAYAHRGLLLDTSRHWLPVWAVVRTLDAMAAVKLNVLHWHATDSHSFPLRLPSVPKLAQYGAYSASQTYGPEDVRRVVEYARDRGIRVVVEFDGPSHAGNGWQWGEQEGLGALAVCVNKQPWKSYCIQPPCGQLNPTNPAVYDVIRDFFRDLLDLLPTGEIIHLGGDEVYIPCWNATSEIVEWLEVHGHGRESEDFFQLWADFHKIELQILDELRNNTHIPTILWTSHLTDPNVIERYLDNKRFIIQTWVPQENTLPQTLLSMGYDIIVSMKDAWYLDHGFWGITKYHRWQTVYETRMPQTMSNGGRVLGGEAAMWGELVDEQGLDSRVWPRTAALAERLWTEPPTSSSATTAAEPRLLQMRERLVRRGIRASSVTPEWCYYNEMACV